VGGDEKWREDQQSSYNSEMISSVPYKTSTSVSSKSLRIKLNALLERPCLFLFYPSCRQSFAFSVVPESKKLTILATACKSERTSSAKERSKLA